jgi:hypothetical protein
LLLEQLERGMLEEEEEVRETTFGVVDIGSGLIQGKGKPIKRSCQRYRPLQIFR